jgi:hypothetical protein
MSMDGALLVVLMWCVFHAFEHNIFLLIILEEIIPDDCLE